MGEAARKLAICFTGLLAAASFTVISPFYAAIALRQGVPDWLIGFIFSCFPVASLIISGLMPKILLKLGRTSTLLIGILIISLSNMLIAFLESITSPFSIIISFVSRILSGSGAALSCITCNTILTSDYPQEISKLMALSQVFVGIGIIIGPAIGSVLFKIGGFFAACMIFGVLTFIWGFAAYLFVGPSLPYVISNTQGASIIGITKKFVRSI